MKLTLCLKRVLMLFKCFPSWCAACTAILSLNWKNNIFFITLCAGVSLTVVKFKLLEWYHSHINKETFYHFFFSLGNLYLYDYDHSVQIWRSKLKYTPNLKRLVQFLICNVFLKVVSKYQGVLHISKISSNIDLRWSRDSIF